MVKITNCHSAASTKNDSVAVNKKDVFKLCRSNKWNQVLQCVRSNPSIAMTPLIMDNNISTTILHQAISSKSDTQARAAVILAVLEQTPNAASIRNGYGSLPLHVICQRNTKMDSQTKERLITALMNACPSSLLEAGGVGGRTPLHIVFTDYVSPGLIRNMIKMGPQAAFTRDKKGWLPIHMACSRHCSPEKLRMLLEVNKSSLHAKTPEGESLLCLAKSKATKSHPNYALISELKAQLQAWNGEDVDDQPQLAQAASLVGNEANPPSASSVVTPEFASRAAIQQPAPAPSQHQQTAATTLDESNGADLLLHFHHAGNLKDDQEAEVSQYAEV
jgi:hypothetical protein